MNFMVIGITSQVEKMAELHILMNGHRDNLSFLLSSFTDKKKKNEANSFVFYHYITSIAGCSVCVPKKNLPFAYTAELYNFTAGPIN